MRSIRIPSLWLARGIMMATDGGEQAGDPQTPAETARDRGDSSLDRLAAWSIDTQAFVRKFGGIYQRWRARAPNSPTQRRTFEQALQGLIDGAGSLEGRLRDIGIGLPDLSPGDGRDGDDQAAAKVYGQLVTTGFPHAWSLMSSSLVHQVLEAQEPNTAAEWRAYFRKFDAVWKGARELGKAASAAQGMLEELTLSPGSRQGVRQETIQLDPQQMLLKEISSKCGELVASLIKEGILHENGQPPATSHDIVKSHGTAGGSGTERLRPLIERLDRYIDALDHLIGTLDDSAFLRVEGDAEEVVSRLRAELRLLLACARYRFEIANKVLHAALQMADLVFVAPREALGHAIDAERVLRDLEIRDRVFSRAVNRAGSAAAPRPISPRSWGELDPVEQAIISHLRHHPESTRRVIAAAMPRFSPATVWRRLEELRKEGAVERDRDRRAHGGRRGVKRPTRSSTAGASRAGKDAGGSAPFIYRLSTLGEGLGSGVADA